MRSPPHQVQKLVDPSPSPMPRNQNRLQGGIVLCEGLPQKRDDDRCPENSPALLQVRRPAPRRLLPSIGLLRENQIAPRTSTLQSLQAPFQRFYLTTRFSDLRAQAVFLPGITFRFEPSIQLLPQRFPSKKSVLQIFPVVQKFSIVLRNLVPKAEPTSGYYQSRRPDRGLTRPICPGN